MYDVCTAASMHIRIDFGIDTDTDIHLYVCLGAYLCLCILTYVYACLCLCVYSMQAWVSAFLPITATKVPLVTLVSSAPISKKIASMSTTLKFQCHHKQGEMSLAY